ncbi:hypothetical protein P691DRAFT_771800 [Macrolepiota fuliginosa MF-IS2]|uniref:Bromo domain-containing protein n=1 Tax=Macrolepiota fuliginosa MF-IS2 TaxID=1400762 RepID=A0A9P6C9D6_9AGAR|nr:hypothetical protein P691DRAFT_771800 [Macrolepiota fuliginosa MF-IS2]
MAKRGANTEGPQLSHIEALLIAQGAWEMGTGASTWPAMAKVLSGHPLLTRPKSFFTAQSCHTMYDQLMQDAGLEPNDENSIPKSSAHETLAQKHYQLRFDELRELILAEENAFKAILKEIDDIKTGKWDARIKSGLTGQTAEEEHTPAEVETSAGTGGEEPFSGSDLSGVTETSPSLTRDDSETPTVTKASESAMESEEQTPQVNEDPQEQTPTAHTETNDMDDEVEEGTGAEETPMEDLPATPLVDSDMAVDAVAQATDKDTEQLRLEEEEEEEENVTANKPEEEETDHEENEQAVPEESDVTEEPAKPTEHKPEEEEEEEDTREIAQEHEEMETEETLPQDTEVNTPRAPSEEREEEATEEPEQHAEEEGTSDEEPAQTTRRSTRNRRPSVSSAPVARKTRRQRRVSEPDAQSPAATEGENVDMDEIKAETPQEDHASSPAPVEPIGTRRRKRKASIVEAVDSPRDRKRHRDESEPVEDEEPGPSAAGRRRRGDRSEEQVALKRFQNVITMLHSQISQHRNGNIFHNPIRTVEAPDYHDIVKRPMDLKTIKGRVKDGLIANSLEYKRDIFLMFANAMMYNRPGSGVYHMAEDMMHESEGFISAFRQTEGLVRGRP